MKTLIFSFLLLFTFLFQDISAQATNNNNGRSNKDKCCRGSINFPTESDKLIFDKSATWYLDRNSHKRKVPSPYTRISRKKNKCRYTSLQ